ncbi:hypothetical protein [Zavarzinella formosa]|uniref:hypothetical protein n=1 Tax=Zavarzinella formosa TaxID=360055 RepID=UPI0002E50F4C|nr:hypothetical protein [Zavarzinella formosa]
MFYIRILLLSAVLLSAFEGACHAQQGITIDQIEKSWADYSARLGILHLEWSAKRTSFKGSITETLGIKAKNGGVLPDANHVASETFSLWADGAKSRLDWNSDTFNTTDESWKPVLRVHIFDGAKGLSYSDQNLSGKTIHSAVRQNLQTAANIKIEGILPVMHWARPLEAGFSNISLGQYEITGAKMRLHGSECIELRRPVTKAGSSSTLWLDINKNYLIIKKSIVHAGKSAPFSGIQEDVEYAKHPSGLWIPKRWTTTTSGWSVPLISVVEGNVDSVDIGGPIAAGKFDTTPPPQTVLTELDGERKTIKIIRDDNGEEPVKSSRISDAIRLLQAPSAPPASKWIDRHPLLLISISLCCLAILLRIVFVKWLRPAR